MPAGSDILFRPLEREIPAGLFGHVIEDARPAGSSEDSAVRLFRALLDTLGRTPASFEVDLRLPELQEAELFGRFPHPRFVPRPNDPLDLARSGGAERRITVAKTDRVADVIEHVIKDTGWFSVGGYGVTIDDAVLIDRMLDGIYMEVLSRKPLR